MQDPSFRFDWSIEAARKNWETLEKFDLNIHRAIASQAHSHTCFGSEFCEVHLLQPLLSYHPLWSRLVTLLTMGVAFPLKPLTEDQRLKDLDLAIARWNHSSARLKSPIASIRPDTRILITKLDFKAAYRCLHTSGQTASQAIVIIDDIALLALHMTFGGAPNPSIWSDISELTCDTCNMISPCALWDPEITPTLESPHKHRYIKPPSYLASTSACKAALPITVKPQADLAPFTDCYLDDLFTCFLYRPTQIWKGSRITLLMLHLLGHPVFDSEPLQ